jgi:hypothetical protein
MSTWHHAYRVKVALYCFALFCCFERAHLLSLTFLMADPRPSKVVANVSLEYILGAKMVCASWSRRLF